jgi:hypothetical protein
VNIRVFPIVPASQQRRFPFDSISLCRRDSESALGKSFLLFTRLSELAPSGAWVEGLIQAARCRTKMPDRIVGARLWRAISARWTVLSYHELPPCLGRVLTGAHRFSLFRSPSGRFRTHFLTTAVKHSCQDVFYFFLMDDFRILAIGFFRVPCSIAQIDHPRLATLGQLLINVHRRTAQIRAGD